MWTKVELQVLTHELSAVQQFLTYLEQGRAEWVRQQDAAYAAQSTSAEAVAATVDVEPIAQDETPAETVVEEQPEPDVIAVEESEVVAALREYATARGLPAATELLATFGAKRVGDIPLERRAEFIGATQA